MIYQYLLVSERRIGFVLVAAGTCETAEAQLPASAPSLSLPWVVGGHPVREFAVADTADGGRTVTLRRTTYREAAPSTFGSITTRIPAAPFAGRRIRIAAELRTHYARHGASLWVRVDDKHNRMLALDNGKERVLSSDHDWVPWTTDMYVVPEAVHITFGLLLWGEGVVRMRNLALTPIELPPADAPTLADARALLDTAITIARTHSVWRDTISWNLLIPELHRLVAGAQTIGGAYPAIQRLVRRLGDHHSEVYPPSSRIAAVLQLMALRDSGACGWVVDSKQAGRQHVAHARRTSPTPRRGHTRRIRYEGHDPAVGCPRPVALSRSSGEVTNVTVR